MHSLLHISNADDRICIIFFKNDHIILNMYFFNRMPINQLEPFIFRIGYFGESFFNNSESC